MDLILWVAHFPVHGNIIFVDVYESLVVFPYKAFIKNAFLSIRENKSPGLDGVGSAMFKKCWKFVETDRPLSGCARIFY